MKGCSQNCKIYRNPFLSLGLPGALEFLANGVFSGLPEKPAELLRALFYFNIGTSANMP